jgi:mannose-6-phosphate isomerase
MSIAGPLLLAPHLVEKPWGGRDLTRYGFDLPADVPIGEAWLTASESTIVNGEHAGRRLGDLIVNDPAGTIGERALQLTRGLPLFPLLIKLLSASENLSIQVHPSDENAPAGSLGKTEAWHVLDAAPGAVLYLGLADGATIADLEQLARRGRSTEHLIRRVPATPGMTIFQAPGSVHALGAGVVIYEIQQPSGVTYRLDDWGRVDLDGRPRELHLDESFAVLDPNLRPEPVPPRSLPSPAGTRTQLVSCPLFTAERIVLDTGESLELSGEGAPQVFTPLTGAIAVTAQGVSVAAAAGQSVVLLAATGVAQVTAREPATIMRGWLDPNA